MTTITESNNGADNNNNNNDNPFGLPKEASCSVSKSSSSSPAVLTFPPNGQLVIGVESQVYKDHSQYLLVGRQVATCDIRIQHKSLSRQHALLYYAKKNSLFVKDLNTKTGTFVNQQRLTANQALELKDGDAIQWGKAQPVFTVSWKDKGEENDTDEAEKEEKDDTTQPQLTGRARREAEIAKMMASLEEAPTYKQYKERPTNQAAIAATTTSSKAQQHQLAMMEKYKLPVSESTPPNRLFGNDDDTTTTTLTTLAMDPTGARFAMGSMDSSLRLYDFAGYSSVNPTPFQNLYIEEGYPIKSIAYSPTGDQCLIATSNCQPKVYDRDGNDVIQFVRGDVYVTDPSKTIGHTAEITAVAWLYSHKDVVVTTSRDASWRIWNTRKGKLSFGMLKCQDVVVVKGLQTGRKTIPTCLATTHDLIILGTECGSVQMYKYPIVSKLRPQQSIQLPTTTTTTTTTSTNAGNDGDPSVQSIVVSVDSTKLATRTSTQVCVWDLSTRLSSSSKPLLQVTLPPSSFAAYSSMPTMAFSPNGKVLCVGIVESSTSTTSQQQQADQSKQQQQYWNSIRMYTIPKEAPVEQEEDGDKKKKKKKKSPIYTCALWQDEDTITEAPALSSSPYPLMGVVWHFKLNQILVATTKEFAIFYHDTHSKKGVLLNHHRRHRVTKRQNHDEDALQELYASRAPPPGSAVRQEEILVPNALPLFGGENKRQKRLEKLEAEQSKQMPQKPAKDIYTTHNTLFAQLVMDQQSNQKQIAGRDPREALAEYSEGKSYISNAYAGNQERILADKTVEEEEEEMEKRKG